MPRARAAKSFVVFLVALSPLTLAETAAEMQQRLNQEVLNSAFHVEDTAKIDSYIADAMQKKLKPKTTPPPNWQPGYTCDSYYRHYYGYNYYGYRDCLYYHRYYGRYW